MVYQNCFTLDSIRQEFGNRSDWRFVNRSNLDASETPFMREVHIDGMQRIISPHLSERIRLRWKIPTLLSNSLKSNSFLKTLKQVANLTCPRLSKREAAMTEEMV
jgi:hypothetical protein